MAHKSAIEWTDATWNPWHGCHKVSAGCKNCYMFRDKTRYGQDPNVVVRSKDATFYAPLKWSEPRTIFTCSWSDFFIEEADAWRDEAFAIMALTPHHTYQVLTKRPERMLEYFNDQDFQYRLGAACGDLIPKIHKDSVLRERAEKMVSAFYGIDTDDEGEEIYVESPMPLPNVWLGVSVEDQKTADERIPLLLQPPVALRWLSIEPLLGPVDLTSNRFPNDRGNMEDWNALDRCIMPNGVDDPTLVGVDDPIIEWVVAGGESGPDARPTHPDWIRSIRDQCQAAAVPFFFKQWGEYAPNWLNDDDGNKIEGSEWIDRMGKKAAGRLLDGREWNEMPEVAR